MRKEIVFILLSILLITISVLLFAQNIKNKNQTVLNAPQSPQQNNNVPLETNDTLDRKFVNVAKVIDGDTIVIDDKTKVRYIGINSTEVGECFAQQATQANKELVEGKKVTIETDVQQLDKYNRLLAYVFIDKIFVNEELVKKGYARVSTYPPNVKYVKKFIEAEKIARANNLGLWEIDACLKTPKPTPRVEPNQVQGAQSQCLIKGNINSKLEKIYHLPGQKFYEKTQIEEQKGERWFCSETEAQDAGWRKSKL